jgi:uncharacterized protein YciI
MSRHWKAVPEEWTMPEIPRMKDVPRNLKTYFLGFLIKGERWDDTEGAEAQKLMPLQLAFLRSQMESRRYVVGGPILDSERLAGFVIIQAASAQEAALIANQDPAVQAKRLAVEIHPVFLPSMDAVQVQY